MLRKAVEYLAGVCDHAFRNDSQGFNAYDASLGHKLALTPNWSPEQERAAWRMLGKYREQLNKAGIDYSAIPQPSDSPKPPQSSFQFILTFGKHNGKSLGELAANDKTRSYVEWLARDSYIEKVRLAAQATLAGEPTTKNVVIENNSDEITAEIKGAHIIVRMSYRCTNFHAAKHAVKDVPGRRWDDKEKVWKLPLSGAARLLKLMKDFDNFVPSEELIKFVQNQIENRAELTKVSSAKDSDLQVKGLGGELMPFQRAGVAYAAKTKNCIIADEMGLGKTIEALATIQHLNAFPAIIICPAAVKINWAREARKWLPDKTVEIWYGRNGNGSAKRADIIIINYDIISDPKKQGKSVLRDDLKDIHPKMVILDESHYIKSHKAKRTLAAKELGKGAMIKLCLTGTPVLNRPNELISPLTFLGHLEEFGGFWYFVNHYCAAKNTGWGWDFSGASNIPELHEKLKATCFIRRKKADVLLELPAKRRAVVPIPLDNEDEYQYAENNLVEWYGQNAARKQEFLDEIADLSEKEQKAAKKSESRRARISAQNAEQLVRIEALKQLAVKGKMASLKLWIKDFLASGEKLVVFAHHRNVVQELAKEFKAPMIMGGDDLKVRQRVIDKFQTNPKCQMIVCSTKAAGVGITLTAASNSVTVELAWTPSTHQQSEARLHRIGQKSCVTSYYLIGAGTIEEEIAQLLDKKQSVIDSIVDGEATQEFSIMSELVKSLGKKI